MLKRLYEWTLAKARDPRAPWILFFYSFVESSVLPIPPPDPVLAVMVLARRRQMVWLVINCTVASIVGSWLGYAIGYLLFESVGRPILEMTHAMSQFATVQSCFNRYGALIILIKGLTPIPYKLITITAGVTKLDLVTFTLASLISRGARFALVGMAIYWIDAPIGRFFRKHVGWLSVLLLVVVLAAAAYLIFKPGGNICGDA